MNSIQRSIKALLLDLSGVLYDGNKVIPGAVEVVRWAREQGLVLRFVTNTATKSSITVTGRLEKMNIAVRNGELFTAPIAAKQYIQTQELRPYCLIHEAIKEEFVDLNQKDPNCVLLGDAQEGLHYESLNEAFRLCMDGAPLIGIGRNKFFKDYRGLNLDAGPFILALEWAAETEAIIMGKPSKAFFDEVVASTPFDANDCLMIGDDVLGDVQGGLDAGLKGCLVRTGKYQSGDEDKLSSEATVLNSIADLLEIVS